MKIINSLPVDDYGANQFYTTVQINGGEATIERIMYFEQENPGEDGADISSLDVFPKRYAAHPRHPNFKYYGNASIEPVDQRGKYWKASLQYSTSSSSYSSSSDKNGKKINSETPPWDLLPDNISFSYPEVTIPFEMAYNEKGKLEKPVLNSAGDIIPATRSVYNLQMSFNFAAKKWDENNGIDYGDTVNSSPISVCGIKIKKGQGLLKPPEATFVTVYQEGTTQIKWQYWNVNVTIVFDLNESIFERKFLNVGDRAKFNGFHLADDLLEDANAEITLKKSDNPSQICRFRKTVKSTGGGTTRYNPVGDIVFCSWEQFIAAREAYLVASKKLMDQGKITSLYELQCEQERQMPLDEYGFIDNEAIENKKYRTVSFSAYPKKSWSSLNLPSKGVK